MGQQTESKVAAPKGAGHTPGPWTVERGSFDRSRYIAGPDGVAVCRMASNTTPKTMQRERDGVHEANARLIAAAPELLAELQRALDWIEDSVSRNPPAYEQDSPPLESGRAALAKAGASHG